MAKQCDMCFQFKDSLSSPLPNRNVSVCKSCAFKLNQTIGFLEYHKVRLSYQVELPMEDKTTKSKKSTSG